MSNFQVLGILLCRKQQFIYLLQPQTHWLIPPLGLPFMCEQIMIIMLFADKLQRSSADQESDQSAVRSGTQRKVITDIWQILNYSQICRLTVRVYLKLILHSSHRLNRVDIKHHSHIQHSISGDICMAKFQSVCDLIKVMIVFK